ncbi:MAG TPA: alpha/beta hydrolase domain-containing protein [Acidimicrobiales bacterium]|nr:alpha/beta hydrolase domain-containing protein [Acidimicrobiales bacterium]
MSVTGPITGGEHGWAFGGPVVDFEALGYASEEYFLEGTASRYQAAGGTALDRDGRWDVEPCESARFKTRFVVYRPVDPATFNGTVIVSWNNVSAGHDLFGGDSTELLEGGYAFVGVTAQRVGVHGIAPMNLGLVDWDKERYGTLSIPSDDYSFDIFTQAARTVGPDRPRAGVDPMGGLAVRHLVALGASQSAGRLGTYVNAIHPITHAFDGYLLQIYFGAGSPLEVGEFVVNLNDPDLSNEGNRRLRLRGTNMIRDDLDVPVMIVNSELEAIACYNVRQPDTDRLRWWESAGTCHVSEQGQRARSPKYVRDFGAPMQVAAGINRIPMIPLFDAATRHMHEWVNGGAPPPVQPRIEFTGDPAEIVRDADGIAKGGIRLPQVEVPIAVNSAIPVVADIFGILGGSSHPFSADDVIARYGDRAGFLAAFTAAARRAASAGVLLPRDVDALIDEAAASWDELTE